ncbi:peptidoglycan DD-metalloendopeptidase family protein [Fibrobacter sp.]|uniref:peptidoglycan DD-metalloendopeptidase family protein n=1 Tax=Fibrobacter sp. TaxID=35828 RepID=UPI00388E1C9A
MKFSTVAITLALPIALFANEKVIELNEPVKDKAFQESEINGTAEQDSIHNGEGASMKSVAKASNVTESEFSGNLAIDTADAGNIDAPASAIKESKETSEAVAAADDANNEAEADSTSEEPEMSQEEADAELAAASQDSLADSTQSKNLLETLNLDMSTAFIPTESRRIAGPYGIRTYRMHRGVDLGLCHGEDRTIVAAFAGVVKLVRNQGRRRGYGKYVIIDHGNGLTTLYAHLAKWNVNIGDTLQAGDTIGVGGNTGRSFGAHLHFEMRYHGIYIDPTTVFDFEQGTFRDVVAVLDPQKLQATEDEYQKELSKHRYYKVRRGDCLGKIARKYGISVTRLKQLNKIKGNMIRPGQVLRCS